jgi:hypothetical protein
MGYRARLLIQFPFKYSRGEASGTRQGAQQPIIGQIEANPMNTVSRDRSKLGQDVLNGIPNSL